MQTGDIMSRMTSDLAQIEFALTQSLAQGLRVILTLIAAVITIFWMDWKLALVAMAVLPIAEMVVRPLATFCSARRRPRRACQRSAAA